MHLPPKVYQVCRKDVQSQHGTLIGATVPSWRLRLSGLFHLWVRRSRYTEVTQLTALSYDLGVIGGSVATPSFKSEFNNPNPAQMYAP